VEASSANLVVYTKMGRIWEKGEILFYFPSGGFARNFLKINKIQLLRIYNNLAHFLPLL